MSIIAEVVKVSAEELDWIGREPAVAARRFEQGLGEKGPGRLFLDRIWREIHQLLTGEEWGTELPLAFLMVGGEQLGLDGSDLRVLDNGATQAVAAALEAIPPEALRERYDPDELYLEGDEEEILDGVIELYGELRTLVQETARGSGGLLISIF